MTDGLLLYLALCGSVALCIVTPYGLILVVLCAVIALCAWRLAQPGAEDPGKRRRERDRS